MSDDDFVTKPLRTYKRRRRAAPTVTTTTSPAEDVLLNTVTVTPKKLTPVTHTKCNRAPILNAGARSVHTNARAAHADALAEHADQAEQTDCDATDLDAFLSSKRAVLGRGILDTILPELEIETVPRDEDEERIWAEIDQVPARKTEEKVPAKEQIASIKMASRSLCNSVSGRKLKQSSLFGVVKGDESKAKTTSDLEQKTGNENNKEKDNSRLPSDQASKKLVIENKAPQTQTGTAEPLRTSSLTNAPRAPLQPRKLVKQAGTSQLDLGAMFGLKPKHNPPPVEKIPEKWSKRKMPHFKWVRGTSFTVDAFCFGDIPKCTAYFLSHFHADHYMGLNKHFTGLLYCSKVTSNYVLSKLGVRPDRVRTLEFEETEVIQGVQVSLISANHCPGSAMFLFESPDIGTILHTGDFRYCKDMLTHPLLQNKTLDVVYLDTTYMDPVYRFPPQREVVEWVVGEVLSFTRDTLIVCGSYTIGKERLVEGIAGVLDCKICVNQTKLNLIKMQDNPELTTRLSKSLNSRVHIVPMKDINPGSLSKLLARTTFSTVVGIKPTGWTHDQNTDLKDIVPTGRGKVRIYSVPYSEHSSYSELEEFLSSVTVKKCIPTVIPRDGKKRQFMFDKVKQWTSL